MPECESLSTEKYNKKGFFVLMLLPSLNNQKEMPLNPLRVDAL